MTETDLPRVADWLHEPHVARWWTDTPAEDQLQEYRRRLSGEGDTATVLLTVTADGVPIGWCQWYRWDSSPEEADAMEALPGEVGIDYAIGAPGAVGRGLGAEMIAALVARIRGRYPGAGVLVDPEAANAASRRVLEHNGFQLVAVRTVDTEPGGNVMALYRLPGEPQQR